MVERVASPATVSRLSFRAVALGTAVLGTLGVSGVEPALAQAQPTAAAPSFWVFLLGTGTGGLAAAGLLGALLGAVVKHAFDERSARYKAKREFAGKIADNVINLSREHYWRLATVSGVLARGLHEAAQDRALHLVMIWETRQDLKDRIRVLAGQIADGYFPHFVVLISSFEKFQFRGSNTYLLTRHAAGEDCKRLYNVFVASLSDELRGRLADVHATYIEFEVPGQSPERKRASEVTPADLGRGIVEKHFPEVFQMWGRWLEEQPEQVLRAADALQAYSEILLRELSDLHEAWFQKKSWLSWVPWFRREQTDSEDAWNVLSKQTRTLLRSIQGSSTLYIPLGAGLMTRPKEAGFRQGDSPTDSPHPPPTGKDAPDESGLDRAPQNQGFRAP